MKNKIFVGRLPYATDSDRLKEVFEQFGPVREAIVVTDRDTGESRGFGFVTFEAEGDAADARERMDGQDFDGRNVSINIAQDKREQGHRR